MATAQRPSAVVRQAEPAPQAVSVLDRPEIKELTTARARAFIESQLSGSGVSFERFMAEVLGAIIEQPKLLECNMHSLVKSVARIGSWGLTIGEKAYLIPYKGVVKAVRDYKGDAELVINAGGARFIDAFNFYSNEPFEHQQGSNPFIRHTPLSPKARGTLLGSYAVAIISGNLPPKIKLMYNDEIDQIRLNNSYEWKNGTLEELPSHFYGPKTCVHQICKLLPTNPRMEKVFKAFEAEEADFTIDDALDPANRIEARSSSTPPEPERPAAAPSPTPAPQNAPPAAAGPVKCPKCGSTDLYDNRAENATRRQNGRKQRPDYKCKGGESGNCDGLIWPPKDQDQTGMKF